MIAKVIPETKTIDIDSFSYSIPDDLLDKIKIGSVVTVPFGKRFVRGVVAEIVENEKTQYEIKPIKSVDPNIALPASYLEIASWIASYYFCTLGEAISIFLPPEMKRPRGAQVESEKLKVASKIELTKEQEDIFQKLKKQLTDPQTPALIHGVTGSGKTEIYIKLAQEVLRAGKQVVALVPEIILTPQTIERFQQIFGDDVTLMHSHLSKSEKYNCCLDFYSGRKSIIVGPRSALLVPSDNIGLIIVDEEQEDSYKQEQTPRYHVVTLAEKIADKQKALLLLGSATPRIETYYRSQNGEINLYNLKERYLKDSMPTAEIVDLREEIHHGNLSPISEKLQAEITEILAKKKQILLFLNRRGSATFVSCRDCGHVMLCQNCAIPLVHHLDDRSGKLVCHHCNYEIAAPTICPECKSPFIRYFGSGIDRIEREIRTLFPSARLAKVDSTTIKSRSDYESFYKKFKNHEVDIVIGTQMIAKGLDIPGVDLVGIVSADTGLHLPHYKAHERSFQILTQVSGRSGRRKSIGRTIIQTYWPESHAILAASRHDFADFAKTEIIERDKFVYPPFTHLIRVVSENADRDKAVQALRPLAEKLTGDKLDFIGPGICFYQRLHKKFRYHLIIKAKKLPDPRLSEIFKLFPHLTWDSDPANLL